MESQVTVMITLEGTAAAQIMRLWRGMPQLATPSEIAGALLTALLNDDLPANLYEDTLRH